MLGRFAKRERKKKQISFINRISYYSYMKSQQLLALLLIIGVILLLFYSGFILKEEARNIVVDGYADDWKGISPASITPDEYIIYKYTDNTNLYLMIKLLKELNNKTIEIKGAKINWDVSLYNDTSFFTSNNITGVTLKVNNRTDVKAYVNGFQILEHEIVYNKIIEIKIPFQMLGIQTGNYLIGILDSNNLYSFKIEV